MFSQIYYLIRSKIDGQYLVARPTIVGSDEQKAYLLIFQEHFEALSYLNHHGAEIANQFGVESLAGNQLKNLLQRWGFHGIGLVKDPLLPRIEFLSLE
jgi:hypothetical protein